MTQKAYDPKAGTFKVGLEQRKKRFDRIKKTQLKLQFQEQWFMEVAWDFEEDLPEVPDFISISFIYDEERTDDYYLLGVSRKELYEKFGSAVYHREFAHLDANERVQRMTYPIELDAKYNTMWCPCGTTFHNADDNHMDDTGNVFCSHSCCAHYGFHADGGV